MAAKILPVKEKCLLIRCALANDNNDSIILLKKDQKSKYDTDNTNY